MEMALLQNLPNHALVEFQQLIDVTMDKLAFITTPIQIMYGVLDDPLYKESAEVIFHNVVSQHKIIKGYPNSKHLMTLGLDRHNINQDILTFYMI